MRLHELILKGLESEILGLAFGFMNVMDKYYLECMDHLEAYLLDIHSGLLLDTTIEILHTVMV